MNRQDMYHSPFAMFFGRKDEIFFFREMIVFCQDALLPVRYASFLGSVAMISIPANETHELEGFILVSRDWTGNTSFHTCVTWWTVASILEAV